MGNSIETANQNSEEEYWSGWGDFLGNLGNGGTWTKRALLNFLKDFRNNFINVSGAELLLLLENAGLEYKLKTDESFKALIRNEEGSEERIEAIDGKIKELEGEVNGLTDDEEIDENGDNGEEKEEKEVEVSDEIEIEEQDTLREGNLIDSFKMFDDEHIHLEDRDEEFVTFLIENRLNKLWNNVINEEITVDQIKKESGGKYFTLIKDTFLSEYEEIIIIKNPANYSFEIKGELVEPSLMQKLTAYRLTKKRIYGNWSGVGAGKTLAGVYAGRHLGLKNTFIVTFNSTISGWKNSLEAYFNDSVVYEKMQESVKFEEGKFNYIVVNYEFFQTPNAEAKLNLFLQENNIDYLILDEVHSVKQRNEDEDMSKRRQLMVKFINTIKESNPNMYSMVMTATPVINNLVEAKKLLELLHGKNYDEYSTNPRIIHSGMQFHKHIAVSGVRYKPTKNKEAVLINREEIDINGDDLFSQLENVTSDLYIDQITLKHKLDAVKKHIRKGTIIYSYFVEDIIDEIGNYVNALGLTVGKFTGMYKEGLDQFRNGEVDVLVGSSPVGTGVDGLQSISDRMIILSLPWTYAEYDQLVGRIARQGSIFKSVNIIIPKVIVNYFNDRGEAKTWSRDVHKLNTIKFKHDLFSIVMDGVIPDGVVTDLNTMKSKSLKKLNEIIEKVQQGIYSTPRQDLEKIYLEDAELVFFNRKLGDFSNMNKDWSIHRSENTHKRISENPNEWKYYHQKYREARETWEDIPFKTIGNKIRKIARPEWVVADLGCGEGLLRNEIDNKIISFDHYSVDDEVVACDISKLPIDDNSVDVAVFSLSLMGSNYKEYFNEAHRVLKGGSWVFVAEPREKWEGRNNGIEELKQELTDAGFMVIKVEIKDRHVYVDAMKTNQL